MATTYSNDIKPKFRPTDISCPAMVTRGIRLGDLSWMCDPSPAYGYPDHGNARHVYDRLMDASMPPDNPWPQSWIDTYSQWMLDGFRP